MTAPAAPLWGVLEAAAREHTAGTPFIWSLDPELRPAPDTPVPIRVTVTDELPTGNGKARRVHIARASTVIEPGTTPQHARTRVARLVAQVAAGLTHLAARR